MFYLIFLIGGKVIGRVERCSDFERLIMAQPMTPHPHAPGRRPIGLTLDNWDYPPYNRWSFQHMREIVPTAPIPSGETRSPLAKSTHGLDVEKFSFLDKSGAQRNAAEFLSRSSTDGLLVLHCGKIVGEHYFNGMHRYSLHILHSVTKSIVGALCGVLVKARHISLDRTVADLVPFFSKSAYGDVTLSQLLDMTSGVDFPENSTDPITGSGLLDIAIGWKIQPTGRGLNLTLPDLIAAQSRTRRIHGAEFEYRSIETEVLGYCIEAALGSTLQELVSTFLWQPMGPEQDANFGLDTQGHAVADGGMSTSLRDLGRFGLLYAQDGAIDGRQVIPADWIEKTRRGDPAKFGAAARQTRPNGAYRNQFWIVEVGKPAIAASGVFGQMLYIDHSRDFVAAKFSSWPQLLDPETRINTERLFSAMASSLSGK
ncbi:MAG: beta-lactamase family protein [Rhizobiaceae bacterium]|nr:beta-lactamase family protein [Rhizobiaceae bacterium]